MSIVSIQKTEGNDYVSVKKAVQQAVADCGGLGDIVKPGFKVLINPNLVAVPDDRLSGGVTRWEVREARQNVRGLRQQIRHEIRDGRHRWGRMIALRMVAGRSRLE